MSQALKEPDKVQILDLKDQGLTEIPIEVFQLTSLTQLVLAGNQIEVIPLEIGQLNNLETLDLSSNYIKSIPSCFDPHLIYLLPFVEILT